MTAFWSFQNSTGSTFWSDQHANQNAVRFRVLLSFVRRRRASQTAMWDRCVRNKNGIWCFERVPPSPSNDMEVS